MLIVAVWTLAILSLLAIGAGYNAWLEMKLTSLELDRMKEERLALAAIQLARSVLPKDLDKPATLKDPWADNETLFKEVRLAEGTFSVVRAVSTDGPEQTAAYGLEDESGRVNLNKATKAALQNLLGDGAGDAAQSIVDWRQKTSDAQQSATIDAFYAALPHPYPCKHAAYESVGELLLVRGMSPERYRKLRPWVTVYGDHVNVNTASRQVLTALGLSATLVDKIMSYRQSAGSGAGAQASGVFESVAEIPSDLSLTGDENAQLGAALPLLGVGSRDFRLHLEVWPGDRPIAERRPAKYEVVLEFLTKGQWTIKQFSRD